MDLAIDEGSAYLAAWPQLELNRHESRSSASPAALEAGANISEPGDNTSTYSITVDLILRELQFFCQITSKRSSASFTISDKLKFQDP
ncbi:hypothetical protein CVT26_006783 [Gymnopilus dilepis]|uniref:Uncharacterized protein n=1 Tax=Gymnopilus dilepis TaxID=231916 RepID=A0A409Y346_9AGAR|nr:hypothetical protein CVT26_006783 [Gymnopilus dilepis]